ncbi:MAG: cellulose biosynthesis cyclic di-GMP-binding regulatory protein BcsB [Hyphomicrobiales bacterium]|nr:cellulose biosynthesis cyclic di-GMP-binding regulatory protein BcsB [Hyphomicrobiales bacterium]
MRRATSLFALCAALAAAAPACADPAALRAGDRSVWARPAADAESLKFVGEDGTRTFPLFLTRAETRSRSRFHLAFTNAVSVMPEASTLTVTLDGARLAQARLAAASSPGVIDVEVPAGLLAPGLNLLKVDVVQRHRVDCSLGATYELWTKLDGAATGLTFDDPKVAGTARLDDLPTLPADARGAQRMRVVAPADADGARLDAAFRAAEAAAIRGGFAHPVVEAASAPGPFDGLEVVAGVRADLVRDFPDLALPEGDGAGVALTPTGPCGAARLVVVGSSARSLDREIASLAKPAPMAAAAAAAAPQSWPTAGGALDAGATVTLAALGVSSRETTGRMFHAGFDVQLPPDFYPADYDKLVVALDAAYAPGLGRKAQVLVRVDGRDATSLSMANPSGALFKRRELPIPLGAFEPGFNRVEIEAQAPAASDAACDVRATLKAARRFALFGTTTVALPATARIAHLPDLGATAVAMFPYQRRGGVSLVLARRDPATIGAAATFLAREATTMGRIVSASTAPAQAPTPAGDAIFFGALGELPPQVAARLGVDAAAARAAWAKARSDAAEKRAEAVAAPTDAAPADIADRWARKVDHGALGFDPLGAAWRWEDRYVGLRGADFALSRRPSPAFAPGPGQSLVLAQGQAPAGGGATWTLVTGPSAPALARDLAALTSPSLWSRVHGAIVAFDPAKRRVTEAPGTAGYFVGDPLSSVGNLRRIAAGWLSSNLDAYAFLMLVGAMALGFATSAVVRRYGVKP